MTDIFNHGTSYNYKKITLVSPCILYPIIVLSMEESIVARLYRLEPLTSH